MPLRKREVPYLHNERRPFQQRRLLSAARQKRRPVDWHYRRRPEPAFRGSLGFLHQQERPSQQRRLVYLSGQRSKSLDRDQQGPNALVREDSIHDVWDEQRTVE